MSLCRGVERERERERERVGGIFLDREKRKIKDLGWEKRNLWRAAHPFIADISSRNLSFMEGRRDEYP